MVISHENMFTIRQETVGLHLERSDDFPVMSCDNSQTNIRTLKGYDRNSSRNRRNTPVNGRNLSGKSWRLSGWNTASVFRMLFRCFPTGTGRHFLTWDDSLLKIKDFKDRAPHQKNFWRRR